MSKAHSYEPEPWLASEFEQSVLSLIGEMVASQRYRALIWAGGFGPNCRHSRSDVDLYAVSARDCDHHWMMERVDGRRVELTTYSLERWTALLAEPYDHPKHHFTFANGRSIWDPELLVPPLRELSSKTLEHWPAGSRDALSEMRNGVAIQRDKIEGFREREMPLHLRMYTVGFALLACGLIATAMYGSSVDAGKNLTRLLEDPHCPADIKALLVTLLGGDTSRSGTDAALALADRCLELTGGPVESHNGGIPR